MSIPPCTTGTHSTVPDTPATEPAPSNAEIEAKIASSKPQNSEDLPPPIARQPIATGSPRPSPSPAPPEVEEEDEQGCEAPVGATCKRKACGAKFEGGSREGEKCVHHPGQPLFHEGSKGWTCCKRKVLEFDEFMKIQGCTTKDRHVFVGKKKDAGVDGAGQEEELLKEVRSDFYQTGTTVIASLYLKKIDKERSRVTFSNDDTVGLDLHTSDGKVYKNSMRTFGKIEPEKSAYKILGTKLELTLAKNDGIGWPVLKADDPHTGEIIQAGRAGRV